MFLRLYVKNDEDNNFGKKLISDSGNVGFCFQGFV